MIVISESTCIAILRSLVGRHWHFEIEALHPQGRFNQEHAASPGDLYRSLLAQYSLSTIDSALRWLDLCGYLFEFNLSLVNVRCYVLTSKGLCAAAEGRIDEADRPLIYQQEEPYAVFVAHQFNEDDTEIVEFIRDRILTPSGFSMLEGRAEGLEEFRQSIIERIRRSRFFLCLLTGRSKLESGGYASSVWLYQETGVAVALDKTPLLLVEENLDTQYVGELTSVYEHIRFTRSNHPKQFQQVTSRLLASLDAHRIPRPVL